jgi:hypothetical protein
MSGVRAALAIVLLATACASELDTAVVLAGSTGGSTAATATSSEPTATSLLTAATTDTSATSEETTATVEPTTLDGSTTNAGESSTSTGTDTEGLVGSACGSEQEVCALVDLDGAPAGECGQTLEIKGIVQQVEAGVWELEDCGACELCGGPTYRIELLAPAGWAPQELPLCSRIAVDYAPMDATPWACSFLGMAVWADDGIYEESAPRFVGTSIRTAPPSDIQGLQVALDNVHPEMCAELDCCSMVPGDYELTFSGAGLSRPLTLGENETALAVEAWSRLYDVHVVRAHAHKECGRIPHFDWVFLR